MANNLQQVESIVVLMMENFADFGITKGLFGAAEGAIESLLPPAVEPVRTVGDAFDFIRSVRQRIGI